MTRPERITTGCILLLMLSLQALAGQDELPQRGDVTLADVLPADTVLFLQRPPKSAMEQEFNQTVLKQIYDHPEMAAFLNDLQQGYKRFAADVAKQGELETAFVESMLDGQLSIAILDATVDESGVDVSYCFAFQMQKAPPEKMIYDAVLAGVQRWRQYSDDPRAPKNLIVVNREQPIGEHTVFRVIHEKPIRFMVLGKTILFYRAKRRDGLERIVNNYDNILTAKTLSKSLLYRKVYKGAESVHGMSFMYINARRFQSFIGALGIPSIMRIMDVTGISGVQAIGCAGGSYKKGIKHTIYLYAPNQRVGLLEAISMKPGAELAAQEVPKESWGIMAARVDLGTLYQKIPELADSIEKAIGRKTPLGIASLAGRQTVLGVPAQEMLAPLGDAVIGQPGPAGPAVRFDLVDLPAFAQVISRMEATLGHKFASKTIKCADGQTRVVRYYNDFRGRTPLPFAPSFCIMGKRPNGMGVVYVSTHPQPIVGILRQRPEGTLKESTDYQQVMEGMGSGYGVFAYHDNRGSYERVYDWTLPLINILMMRPNYMPDAGLLPPGNEISKHIFGVGMGIRSDKEGITFTAYSPIGMGAGLVTLADTPVIHGMIATAAAGYFGSEYHYQKTGKHLIDTSIFGAENETTAPTTKPGERIPGISDQ